MKSILIVDDKEENLYLLQVLLTHHGYRVDNAHNGAEALAKARRTPPDLVISDILMPVMDGFALCRAWKADAQLKHVPLVFYTATYTDSVDERLALDLGADAFIVKPTEPEAFMARIRAVLAATVEQPVAPHAPTDTETVLLKEYNQVLVHKLEQKLLQLEASEQYSSKLFEYAPDGILIADSQSHYLDANPAICRMLGYSRAELIGMQARDIAAPSEVMHIKPALQAIHAHADYHREWQLRRKDGSLFDAAVSATTMPDGNLLATIRDITDLRQAQALLSMQKQVLEMIATGASLPETLAALIRHIEAQSPGMQGSILLLDEDGMHVRLGAAPSLPAEFVAAIAGQPIGPCAGSCGTAAYRKEAVFVEDIASDPLWVNYKVPALTHGLHASWSTPIFDAQRRVLGMFAMYYHQPGLPQPEHFKLIDTLIHLAAIAISHQREKEILRQSEEKFSTTFNVGPGAMSITRVADGKFIEVNASFLDMFGFSREEMIGHTSTELNILCPEERARLIPRQIAAGGLRNAEQSVRTKSGRVLNLLFSSQPLQVDGEDCFVSTLIDITCGEQMKCPVL